MWWSISPSCKINASATKNWRTSMTCFQPASESSNWLTPSNPKCWASGARNSSRLTATSCVRYQWGRWCGEQTHTWSQDSSTMPNPTSSVLWSLTKTKILRRSCSGSTRNWRVNLRGDCKIKWSFFGWVSSCFREIYLHKYWGIGKTLQLLF